MIASSSIPDAGFAQRPRVLLADDHPAMLALTADALAGEYWWSVGDGYELLAEAERLHTNVIALDITILQLDVSKWRANSGARTSLPVSSSRSTKTPTRSRPLDARELGY